MPFSKSLIATLMISLCHAAWSAALSPAHFPKDLMYHGKPIDPACLVNTEHARNSHIYDLSDCSRNGANLIYSVNHYMDQKGFYGSNWQYQSTDQMPSERGSAFYKAWPAGGNQYWVLSVENTGGSGDFTTISLVTRLAQDRIKIKNVHSGDRCNGGISTDETDITSRGFRYSLYMTPGDFLDIRGANPHHLRPYKDLDACAVCCTAKAAYVVDLRLKPKFDKIEFIPAEGHTDSANNTYQNCFDQIKSYWIKNNHAQLIDMRRARKFMDKFNTLCVDQASMNPRHE